MKRTIAAIAAAVMTAAMTGSVFVSAEDYEKPGPRYAEPEPICGDLNDDGSVDTFDLVLMRGKIGSDSSIADLDGDGVVDEYDLKILSDFLLSAGDTDSYSPVGSVQYTPRNVRIAADSEVTEDIVKPQMKFSVDLLKKTFSSKKEKNLLVSPLSVNVALGMTANGAAGDTLTEYMDELGGGMDLASYNDCMADMIARLTSSEKSVVDITDSVWFRQNGGEGCFLKKPFLDSVARYFGADAYGAPFDEQTVRDINKWVSHGTHGIINELFEKAKDIEWDELLLINTLYFKGTWESPYMFSRPDVFTNYNGEEVLTDFLTDDERWYIEGNGYTGFRKDYEGNDFSFVGILPAEGTDIYDFVESLDAEELHKSITGAKDIYKSEERVQLRTRMPKLKYDNDMHIKDLLADMGLSNAMSGAADYSNMSDVPLFVSDVIHKTAIELDESGTVAAAVTVVAMQKGVPMYEKTYEVYLDRPYVYMIMDNKTGLPLFIGVVTELNGTPVDTAE